MDERARIGNDVALLQQLYQEFLALSPEISSTDVTTKELALNLNCRWELDCRVLQRNFKGKIKPNSHATVCDQAADATAACETYCQNQLELLPEQLQQMVSNDSRICLQQKEIIFPGDWRIFQYYPECESCAGSGSVPCPACSGEKSAKCSQCHGSGTQICKDCNGHGRNTTVTYPEFYAKNELHIDWQREKAPRWFYGLASTNHEFAKYLEKDIQGGLQFLREDSDLSFSSGAALLFEQISVNIDRPARAHDIAVERSTGRYTLNAIGNNEAKALLLDFMQGKLDLRGLEQLKDIPLFKDWFDKREPLWRKARTLNFVSSDIEQWLKTGLQKFAASLAALRKKRFWRNLFIWTPITITAFFVYAVILNTLFPALSWDAGPALTALFNPLFTWSHFYQQMIAVGDDCSRYAAGTVCVGKWSIVHFGLFSWIILLLSPYRFVDYRKYLFALLVATPVAAIFVALEPVFLQIVSHTQYPDATVLGDPEELLGAFHRTLPALASIALLGAWYSLASASQRSRAYIDKQLARLDMPKLRDYISG